MRSSFQMGMQQVDKNGDRRTSRQEAPAFLRRGFDAADADNDGALNYRELGQALRRAASRRQDRDGDGDDLSRRI